MGQGILYRYNHHMLVSPENAVSTEKEQELIRSIQHLPLEEQVEKVIESNLPGFEYISDKDSFENAFDVDCDLDEDFSVDYQHYLNGYEAESCDFIRSGIKGEINELAKSISESLGGKYTNYRSGEFDGSQSLTKICECNIDSNYDVDIEIGVGTFSDGDNYGVVVYLESSTELELQPDTNDIKNIITESLQNYALISDLQNENYTASDDIVSVSQELDGIFRYWSEDGIIALFGEDNMSKMSSNFDKIETLLEEETLDSLSKEEVNQIVNFHAVCIKHAVESLQNEAERIESIYNQFAYKLFNALIKENADGLFFGNSGNAWIGHSYGKESLYYEETKE